MAHCIRIGSLTLPGRAALAPMAGVADAPFRALAARFGAPYVVSEMIASREMVAERKLSVTRADLSGEGTLAAVQLAGNEAHWLAEAARMSAGQGAAIIDINMGCPAKKVTTGLAGSALMRDPDHALRLIEAVAMAVDVPVTLKMRLGWCHDSLNAADIARRAAAAGVALFAIHGRTRQQLYTGKADWGAVRTVVDAVDVPVLVNGDIASLDDARSALAQSGADGVMVGRKARGAPWLVGQIDAGLAGAPSPQIPRGTALCETIIGHYEAMLCHYGRDVGGRCARKHLGWWVDGLAAGRELRAQLVRLTEPKDVIDRLQAFDWEGAPSAVAA